MIPSPAAEARPGSAWMLTSDPVGLNAVLVVGSERALLVDSGAGPDQAVRIRTAVRALTALPLVVAITHDHWDHLFGCAAFADDAEAFCGSPQLTADAAGSVWLQHAEAHAHEPSLPPVEDLVASLPELSALSDGEEIDLGGVTVTALVAGGHTETDLALCCGPLLIVGDLLEEGAPPQIGEDSSPGEWVRSLDRLLALPGVSVFAPGHGRPVGPAFAAAQRDDLAAVDPAAPEAAELPLRCATDFPDSPAEAGSAERGQSPRDGLGVVITRLL